MLGKKTFHFFAWLNFWLNQETLYSQQSPFIFSLYQGLLKYLDSQVKTEANQKKKADLLCEYFCSLTPAQEVLVLAFAGESKEPLLYGINSERLQILGDTKGISDSSKDKASLEIHLQRFLQEKKVFDYVLVHDITPYPSAELFFDKLVSCLHENSILGLGNIHKSREWEIAWKKLKEHPRVQLSLDFFDYGFVFLSYPGKKIHKVLAY
ncbi:MAG: hypothetical protein ACKO44_00305 [Algoriphagus sp.]